MSENIKLPTGYKTVSILAAIAALVLCYWLFETMHSISPGEAEIVAQRAVEKNLESGFIKHRDLFLVEAQTDGYPFLFIFRSKNKPSFEHFVIVHRRGQVEISGGRE